MYRSTGGLFDGKKGYLPMKHKSKHAYQCWICGQEFDKFPDFKYHIRNHTGEKQHRMSHETEISVNPTRKDKPK